MDILQALGEIAVTAIANEKFLIWTPVAIADQEPMQDSVHFILVDINGQDGGTPQYRLDLNNVEHSLSVHEELPGWLIVVMLKNKEALTAWHGANYRKRFPISSAIDEMDDPMIAIQESWNKDVASGAFDPRDS